MMAESSFWSNSGGIGLPLMRNGTPVMVTKWDNNWYIPLKKGRSREFIKDIECKMDLLSGFRNTNNEAQLYIIHVQVITLHSLI